METQQKVTKKERIIELYDRGLDVEAIADALNTDRSYVANVLIKSGRPVEYENLYVTTSGRTYSEEARRLSGVLRFKDPAAAQESVRMLDEAYKQFEREGNKRGQHHVQMLALIGKNRAEGIGKTVEAAIFRDWLIRTLRRQQCEEEEQAERAS
ncbi:MAG: hypothetical protein K6T99_09670 [Armatimonadetes bacterium]|nr:hypothetical protein [Armatimonadota bacterium]